jgi:hypothetical protein
MLDRCWLRSSWWFLIEMELWLGAEEWSILLAWAASWAGRSSSASSCLDNLMVNAPRFKLGLLSRSA